MERRSSRHGLGQIEGRTAGPGMPATNATNGSRKAHHEAGGWAADRERRTTLNYEHGRPPRALTVTLPPKSRIFGIFGPLGIMIITYKLARSGSAAPRSLHGGPLDELRRLRVPARRIRAFTSPARCERTPKPRPPLACSSGAPKRASKTAPVIRPSRSSPGSWVCPHPCRGRRRCDGPAAAAAPRAGWGSGRRSARAGG